MLKLIAMAMTMLAAHETMAIPVPIERAVPVLYKDISSGFVPVEHAFTLKCDIFLESYRMVLIKNGKTTTIEKAISLPPSLQTKITEASLGTMSYTIAPADIGNQVYGAHIKQDGKLISVDLGSTLDSRTISKNSSPSAEDLKTFIDQTCIE